MKTAIKLTAFALGLIFSTTAFAETAKPVKHAKLDTMTTQSIEPAANVFQCNTGFTGFKAMKACGDASLYPVNALSGMNLN